MDCSKLLKKGKTLVKTLLLHCFQFGDSGKGKLSDLLAGWANIIFRATGGPNAGHTICCGGQELVTHLVPSGILYDSLGKINIIGSGTAVYPWALLQELEQLKAKGLSYNNLRLAFNAKLTLPTQVVWDRVLESVAAKEKIGSTGKGIAPTYADFVNRFGLSVNDLINPDFFHRKLKRHVEYYRKILKSYDSEMIKTIMGDKYLESGLYYNPKEIFDLEAIYQRYQGFGQELKGLITDTDTFIRSNVGKLNILGEGSQGDLLDIEYGTYPYVTSSSCTVPGLAKGAGLDMGDIDLSIGIFRGFYMTRVGKGPFPTELGGQRSDDWCNGGEATKEIERRLYGQISVDETDEFLLGVLLRHKGNEYGSTTERPRRTGWLDLPLLQYVLSLKFNNPDAVLTKLDVLNDLAEIKICERYEYLGPVYYQGYDRVIKPGDFLDIAIPAAEVLQYCRPVYVSFPGWQCDLSGCSNFASLPQELKNILAFVVKKTGINPRGISIGPDREEIILL